MVYFDSERIAAEAILTLPESRQAYPFTLILQLSSPNGNAFADYSLPIDPTIHEPIRANFSINAAELFAHQGMCTARLHIHGIGAFPNVINLTVPRRHTPETDLEIVAAELVSVRADKRQCSPILFADSESAEFCALLRAKTLPKCKFKTVFATLRLSYPKENRILCSAPRPLTPENEMYRVAFSCNSLLEGTGDRDIRLFVGDRMSYEGKISVVSRVHAAKSIEVGKFDLDGVDNAGRLCRIGRVVFASEIHTLRPHLALHTPCPSLQVEYVLKCVARIDNVLVADYTMNVVLARAEEQIIVDDIVIPRISKDERPRELFVEVSLEGRCLTRREILIRPVPPKFAGIQARLIQAGITLGDDSE